MALNERQRKEQRCNQLENQILHREGKIEQDRAHLAKRKAEAEASGDIKKIAYWAGYYPERMFALSERELRTIGPLRMEYTQLFNELHDTEAE